MMPPLIVIGTGPEWEYEYTDILKIINKTRNQIDIMGINNIGLLLNEPMAHFVSAHSEQVDKIVRARICLSYPKIGTTHSIKGGPNISQAHEPPVTYGTSALLGVFIGKKMGYRRIITVGIGLVGKYEIYYPSWKNEYRKLKHVLRCHGLGKLPKLFGKPTKEWVNQ